MAYSPTEPETSTGRLELAVAFERLMSKQPTRLLEASARLLPRVRDKAVDKRHWATTFSNLTTMYPGLQARRAVDPGLIATANLAHLLLMIHTFVDDRVTDQQIELEPAEAEFSKTMLKLAEETLESFGGERAIAYLDQSLHRYTQSKRQSLIDERNPVECLLNGERLAADRASLGGVAAWVLDATAGADSSTLGGIQEAFSALAIGLQWIDDTEDWREDLTRREDNLVLYALKMRGTDVYQLPPGAATLSTTAATILSDEAIEFALDCSVRWLERAATLQHDLGRSSLETEIRRLQMTIRSRETRLVDLTASELTFR